MNCIPISTLWHFAMKDESVHIEGSKVCHETWWSVQFPSEHGVQLFGSSVSKCFKFVTWSSRIKPPPTRAENIRGSKHTLFKILEPRENASKRSWQADRMCVDFRMLKSKMILLRFRRTASHLSQHPSEHPAFQISSCPPWEDAKTADGDRLFR